MAPDGTTDAAGDGQPMARHGIPSLLAQEVEGEARPASRAKGDARSDSQAEPRESFMECRTNHGYVAVARL